MKPPLRNILTIAGSDPCGGAGIQADLRTLQAMGVHGMAVITALTVQNTTGLRSGNPIAPELVAEQLDFLLDDIVPDALKTGMLGTSGIVQVVAERVRKYGLKNLVVDTVIQASDSTLLLDDDAVGVVREQLLPLAHVVKPNMEEAARLCGFKVCDIDDMMRAAEAIHALGAAHVIITGGHMKGCDQSIDLLFDGKGHHLLPAHRLAGREDVHGTGCIFSAALAAALGLGEDMLSAAEHAKNFVYKAIQHPHTPGKGRSISNTVK